LTVFLHIGRMRYEALAGALTLEELEAAVPTVELLAKAARRRKEAGALQSEGITARLYSYSTDDAVGAAADGDNGAGSLRGLTCHMRE